MRAGLQQERLRFVPIENQFLVGSLTGSGLGTEEGDRSLGPMHTFLEGWSASAEGGEGKYWLQALTWPAAHLGLSEETQWSQDTRVLRTLRL